MKPTKTTLTLALLLVCSGAFAQGGFVRGDKVVFEDNLANEKVGSSPSKWEVGKGSNTAKIALVNGEKVIMFQKSESITAILTTPNKSLPENFTIELDFTVSKDTHGQWDFSAKRNKDRHTSSTSILYEISGSAKISEGRASWSGNPGGAATSKVDMSREGWHRLAISYKDGAYKVFIDGKNVISASNVLPSDIFTVGVWSGDANRYLLRNILICEYSSAPTANTKPAFVPGSQVIFEDNFAGDRAGAAPSKWNSQFGRVEIARLNNENVLAFSNIEDIIPNMNASKNYLSDNFTVEVDFYTRRENGGAWTLDLLRPNRDDEGIRITWGGIVGKNRMIRINWYTNFGDEHDVFANYDLSKEGWNRLALSYNQGVLNVYINETHVYNARNVMRNGWLRIMGMPYEKTKNYLRNIRIAKNN